eukprot:Colp12_sorted_trinity150504_noHs@36119
MESESPHSQEERLKLLRRASVMVKGGVNQIWSKGQEQDVEVDDELSKAQKQLKDLKVKISTQSKENFALEKDVRYLDSRIALLINHRITFEELAIHLEDESPVEKGSIKDDRMRQHYANLLYILQTEPQYIAKLARLMSLAEVDGLLQTVMFTLYGNQYESREEHLLLSMFEIALKMEFDEATDLGSLMRANTAITRMMTTYTRRGSGQGYIKNVLSDKINEVISNKDLNLEINPMKVYEQMINDIETQTGETCTLPRNITMEEAALNQDVQKIIVPRVEELRRLSADFLTVIINSIDSIPYGIRWLCKQIKRRMREKYPENMSEAAALIGGFFLLRFVNPAIVTPQAYMLIADKPSHNARRTLTLVAKLLQNLGNKAAFSKEKYMACLADFGAQNQERLDKFFEQMCNVEDFYDELEMDKYVSLSKKDLSVNITLNELYNIQQLLVDHMDEVCADEQDHLRQILKDLTEYGPVPAQVPKKENKTLNVTIYSRWEQSIPESVQETRAAAAKPISPDELLY